MTARSSQLLRGVIQIRRAAIGGDAAVAQSEALSRAPRRNRKGIVSPVWLFRVRQKATNIV
jgi:hypothetical protein